MAVLDLQKIIFDLKASGIGLLVTDHNVRETLSVTDRAYIINEGRIFRAGTPEQLGNDPEVKTRLLRRELLAGLGLEFPEEESGPGVPVSHGLTAAQIESSRIAEADSDSRAGADGQCSCAQQA